MSNAVLKRLADERASQETFIAELLASAEERDLVQAELDNVKAAETRIAEIDAQIKPLADFESRKRSAIALDGILGGGTAHAEARIYTAPRGDYRSLGEQFVGSEEYGEYRGRGSSAPFAAAALPWEMRAAADPLLTTTTDPKIKDMLPAPSHEVRNGEFRQHPLLGLVSREETSVAAGQIVVTGDASGADVVAEGAKKPAITWTDTVQNWSLQTVAGWKKFSRQTLDDIPGFRSFIDNKLQRALYNKLEDLAEAALMGMFTAGNTTTGASKVPLEQLIRNAIGTLNARGVYPDAVALNPADHAAIDIAVMKSTLLGPAVQSSYFGLSVVSLPSLPAGTAVVGSVSDALVWKSKNGVNLYITDSDVSDAQSGVTSDFRTNILTALLETRAAFVPVDASVLQKVTVTP